jgi:serine/threonine protein kinase
MSLRSSKVLDTFQPKSEHIIALHESFQTQSRSWAVPPEMSSVAYLHKLCITRKDIKPQNLVVDRHFCLKNLDFDVVMEVEDEDVVYGKCGTKGWMAPAMVDKSMYSPIKADRWLSEQAIFYLLDNLGEEDKEADAT